MSMRKGLDALEIVFMMFILIVVTLVIIRLFTKIVTPDSLPPISDFQQAYNYQKEVSKCGNACSGYTTSDCQDTSAAVTFCQQKVAVSIDGNDKGGEKGHFGVVRKTPYCEDGLYCFHIKQDCGCGGYYLDAMTCRDIMLDYYLYIVGYSEETTNEVICKSITPGKCKMDPRDWGEKSFERIDYRPQPALGSDADHGVGNPPVIGSDYWWRKAGYGEMCGVVGPTPTTAPSGVSFGCKGDTTEITCSWTGCTEDGVLVLQKVGGGTAGTTTVTAGDNSYTFTGLSSGTTYRAVITCGSEGMAEVSL